MTSDPFSTDPDDKPTANDPYPPESASRIVERLREGLRNEAEQSKARRSFWRELPVLVLIALVVAVIIKTFLVQAFFIESGSMRDTLLEGDRVMVNKLSYRLGDESRGDIVVFDPPGQDNGDNEALPRAVLRNVAEAVGLSQPKSEFIKRIVALEGETIEIRDNRVFIDGRLLDEPYLGPAVTMADFGPETVPAKHVFVMGDNRAQSRDSRFFGSIATEEIIGRAFVTVWPPSRWSGL